MACKWENRFVLSLFICEARSDKKFDNLMAYHLRVETFLVLWPGGEI